MQATPREVNPMIRAARRASPLVAFPLLTSACDGPRRVRAYRILDPVGGRLRAAMRRLGPFALMASCAALVIIAPGLAAAQAGCDLPPHAPAETAAYRIIKDLLYANASVDSAYI